MIQQDLTKKKIVMFHCQNNQLAFGFDHKEPYKSVINP